MMYDGMSNGESGEPGATPPASSQSSWAVANGSGNRSRRNEASSASPPAVAAAHCVHNPIWLDARTSAAPSSRVDSSRADDASLKAIDMAPPHLLASNADQAVRIVVVESTITAT